MVVIANFVSYFHDTVLHEFIRVTKVLLGKLAQRIDISLEYKPVHSQDILVIKLHSQLCIRLK